MVEIMQETGEVQRCINTYPWLIQMVKSKKFYELCDQHNKKQRCYFCCDCRIAPLCALCYKSDHLDHDTIQTYRSSHQTGIRKERILQYMDTSGINSYTINGKPIVYINRRRDNENHRFRNNVLRKCQVCGWELDAASSALFCSIECKFRRTLGSKFDELMESNSEILEDVDELMESKSEILEDVEPVKKKRRHRRKGIPIRAPLK